MKREYASKMTFIHSLQPWAHTLILQRSVLKNLPRNDESGKMYGKNFIFCKNNNGQRGPPRMWLQGRQKEQVGNGSPQKLKNPMMKRNQKVA
jgi:hypothetical protein